MSEKSVGKRRKMRCGMAAVAVVLVMLLSTMSGLAQTGPDTMNFQGRLLDDSGSPLEGVTRCMSFRMCSDADCTVQRWPESGYEYHAVTTESGTYKAGLFTVTLGDSADYTDWPISPRLLYDDDTLYLEIAVSDSSSGCDTATYTAMIPRSRLRANAYAQRSRRVRTEESDSAFLVSVTNTGAGGGIYGLTNSTTGIGVFGSAGATSGPAYGLYGQSASTSGSGVYGYTSATSGTTYGVYGESGSTSGSGVRGHASATSGATHGVWGAADSKEGSGVYGYASAAGGYTYGAWGVAESTEGTGVYGYAPAASGSTYGVLGKADSTSGRGVVGNANASSGATAGVEGQAASAAGYGVVAYNSTSGAGLGAWSASGDLLQAYSGSYPGGALRFRVDAGGEAWAGPAGASRVWHAGNDGAGSGLDADLLDGQHGGDFWVQGGNSFGAVGVLGTNDNYALELEANNSRGLRLEPNATSLNWIGGYSGNWVTSGAFGATIGGGGASGNANYVTDNYGVVGGGTGNQAGDNAGITSDADYATVGGGLGNTAGDLVATVGGGSMNTASGMAATVGGGSRNSASQYGATASGGLENASSASYATVGGGYGNTASGESATVPGGRQNVAQGNYSFAAGSRAKANSAGCFVWADSTDADLACDTTNQFAVRATGGILLTIDTGGGGLRLEPDATSPNLIGGYSGNWVTAGVYGATIGGGGESSYLNNRVTDHGGVIGGGAGNQAGDNAGTVDDGVGATVGGGYYNIASDEYATVGGGVENDASGAHSTVAGGYRNTASGYMATVGGGDENFATGYYAAVGGGVNNSATTVHATVGGGEHNAASGQQATVGGGAWNTASGWRATVPGGSQNDAQGDYSFAAGRRAQADYQGCFVWGDSTDAEVTCQTSDRWVARASGGVVFYTNAEMSTGVYLASGDGSWSSLSDRALKDNLALVDGRDILARLAGIPITTWNYKAQDPSIRHIGPMAQDFYAAFQVGGDDTHITTIDADGVALAAIQGLYAETQALKAENASQQEQIDMLRQENADLEARLAAVEQAIGSSTPVQPQAGGSLPLSWLVAGGLVIATGGGVTLGRRRLGRSPKNGDRP